MWHGPYTTTSTVAARVTERVTPRGRTVGADPVQMTQHAWNAIQVQWTNFGLGQFGAWDPLGLF